MLYNKNKKGVSLVTVLLFMLVATIAATATFKWLSSEGRSSTSRLMLAQARQTSRAGLENARSWMTYHANDVGALIHQYYASGKKPVRLNGISGNVGGANRSVSIWLTGVETDKVTYKLKISSVGTSSDGTKYSENSIFNVNGLYRIKIPEVSKAMGFDQAFSGKFGNATGDNVIESGMINGNFQGNIPEIGKSLLVTGNLTYQGGTNNGGDLFIKGNFSNQGKLVIGKDGADSNIVYIGGNMTNCAGAMLTVYGDLYVGGNIAQNCKIYASGNITVNGALSRSGDAHGFEARKNLVFTENASWSHNDGQSFSQVENVEISKGKRINVHPFYAGVNMLLPRNISVNNFDQNGDRNMELTGKVWQYSSTNFKILEQGSPKKYGVFTSTFNEANISSDQRKSSRFFSFSANGGISDPPIAKWDKNNNILKNIGSNYWQRIQKMNQYGNLIAEDNKVPQPLLLNDKNSWLGHTGNSACAAYGFKKGDGFKNSNVDALTKCYKGLQGSNPDALYSNFLIIDIANTQLNDVNMELDGKFVFYFADKPSDMRLPPTKSDATVMLYFKSGAGQLQKGGNGAYYHYFIYSEGNIARILDGLDIQGSIIMANDTQLDDLNRGSLHYEASVLQDLSNAGIIRENPEYTKRANPDGTSGSGASGGSSDAKGALDDYYISNSPQLSISLESQYKNEEIDLDDLDDDEYTVLEPSIMVLPRVIYMTQDPVGKLEDYYNVVNLNGAHEVKSASNVSCSPGGIPTTGALHSGETSIPDDLYNCKYSSDYGEIPFWVLVSGKTGETPKVEFQGAGWAQLTPGGDGATVSMVVEPSTQSGTMTVDVMVRKPTGWTITPRSGVTKHNVSSTADGVEIYTVSFTANAGTMPLFYVAAPAGTGKATAHFELVPPNKGCIIGSKSTYDVDVTGFATVTRENVPKTYCNDHEKIFSVSNFEYDCNEVTDASWPSCNASMQPGVWIYPYCNSLTTTTENEAWKCGTNLGISLKNKSISNLCEAFVPDSTVEPENDGMYTLYASLKRKRYKLYVETKGDDGGVSVSVTASPTKDGAHSPLTSIGKDGNRDVYYVYADYHVNVTVDPGPNAFSNWKCSGTDCRERAIYSKKTYDNLIISGDNVLTAAFNERDKHCFFDSFSEDENSKGRKEDFVAFCSQSNYENCVDKCASGTHCDVGSGSYPDANWTMVYANHYGGLLTSLKNCAKKRSLVSCDRFIPNEFDKPGISEHSFTARSVFTGNLIKDVASILSDSRSSPTFLLNRVKAGFNGTMTVKRVVPADLKDKLDDLLDKYDTYNDAVVLRSNIDGSEYLSVNVFKGSKDQAYARVCYATSQIIDENPDCVETNFVNILNGSYVLLTGFLDFTARVTLNGSTADFTLTLNTLAGEVSTGSATLDLTQLRNTSLSVSKEGNEYAGLKMWNPGYEYRDMSWLSEDYADSCFATPRIYCSFANQYTGGAVPVNEDVTPWVGTSSWFDESGSCGDVEYYYNGCDMPSSYMTSSTFRFKMNTIGCGGDRSTGGFWYEGAKINGEKFNFTEEGEHHLQTTKKLFGDLTLSGYAKKASVKIQCGSSTYTADCGKFYVGEIISCSENSSIYSGSTPKYCSAESGCDILLDDGKTVNLRYATVMVNVSNLAGGTVNISLMDVNNVESTPYTVSTAGMHAIDVGSVSEVDGFDPQNIRGIVMYGTSYYEISSVESSCPFAPGIGNGCYAELNATGGAFDVYTPNISNVEMAAGGGCVVKNDQGLISDVSMDCPLNGKFPVPIGTLRDIINNGEDEEKGISFTVSMTDKNGNVTQCTTPAVTMKKTSMSCQVKTGSIYAGDNLPSFQYFIKNCPPAGCDAEVELIDKTPKTPVNYKKACSSNGYCDYENWSPTVNLTKGHYTYRLTYSSLDPCLASFDVLEAEPAHVYNCRVEGKIFRADVEAPSFGVSKLKLYYNDPLGHTIGAEQATTASMTVFEQSLNAITAPGTYNLQLAVNGEKACPEDVVYVIPGSSSSGGAAAGASSSSAAVGGALGATCPRVEGYANDSIKNINFHMQNVPVQDIQRKIYVGTSEIGSDGFCNMNNTYGCENMSMLAPANGGDHEYILKGNGRELCRGTVSVKKKEIVCHVENENGDDITGQEVPAGSVFKVVWECKQPNPGSFGANYKQDGNYAGGADCSNGVCRVKITNASSGTHNYSIDSWNCDASPCTNTVKVAGGSGTTTPSSSSIEGNATKIDSWNNEQVLGPGIYDVARCNSGSSGTKTAQIYANYTDCWNSVANASGAGYWNNSSGNCDGQATVSFPTRVYVAEGGSLKLRGCW